MDNADLCARNVSAALRETRNAYNAAKGIENKEDAIHRDAISRRNAFRKMAINMAALIPKLPGGTPGIFYFGRADGRCLCERCGLEYRDHPVGMEEHLVLLCDGKQVKL